MRLISKILKHPPSLLSTPPRKGSHSVGQNRSSKLHILRKYEFIMLSPAAVATKLPGEKRDFWCSLMM